MKLRGAGHQVSGYGIPPDLCWPKRGWSDANAAMDCLFDLFPDKYPLLSNETADHWTFELSWPKHVLEAIDPMLHNQARKCYGLGLEQLADYFEVRRYGRADFLFSMFHSWALAAPALTLARRDGPEVHKIFHVDAHHDLAATLLCCAGPRYLANSALGIECHLNDFKSTVHAIHRGFIHKGNFLSAFILGMPRGDLFHIQDQISPAEFWLEAARDSISVGDVVTGRDFLRFQTAPTSDAWHLLESPRLPSALSVDQAEGVWIDVDLDAFCNRFDGDSDRREQTGSLEEFSRMEHRINSFLADFTNAPWLSQVVTVSVAASPGFFPSEYWEYAIPRVCGGVATVLSNA